MRFPIVALTVGAWLLAAGSVAAHAPGNTSQNNKQLSTQQQFDQARVWLEGREVDLSGARKTKSGMWIVDVKPGKGASPKKSDKVEVHYTGWLTSGKKFDSSKKRNEPLQFSLAGGVIEGWLEGAATMKPGGKRYLIIPPEMAYRARSRGNIPANSVLIFEIDFLRVVPPPKSVSEQIKEAQRFLEDRNVSLANAQEARPNFWIIDVNDGDGNTPAPTDQVEVHYTGWLTNGTKFDSSKDRHEPFQFNLSGRVIEGWLEGARTMSPGQKRYLIIPPEMGYGARGFGKTIPGNSVLIFEIDFLRVVQ